MEPQSPRITLIRSLSLLIILISIFINVIRYDFNIAYSFIILIILVKYYYVDQKLYLKVMIHLSLFFIGFDLLLLFLICPGQFSDSKNYYTKSLKLIRFICLLLSVIEIGLKGILAFFSYLEFGKYASDKSFLLNFEYSQEFPTLNKSSLK